MKITTKNAAIVMDFDLAGIIHWASVVSNEAGERGPGHLAAIRDASRTIIAFAKSLSDTQADVIGLVPDAPALPAPADWTPAVRLQPAPVDGYSYP